MTHDRDAQGADSGQVTADLDAALAALRADPVLPPRDLQARVLAEAQAWQDRAAPGPRPAVRPAVRAAARAPRFAGVWASLGGWGGGAGLVTATMVGLVVGFGAPDVVTGVTGVADDTAVAAWLWPDVGTVIDGLSAAGEG